VSPASTKLGGIARADPELAPYARLLAIAIEAAADDWLVELPDVRLRLERGRPALHEAPLTLPQDSVQELWQRLTAEAPSPAGFPVRVGPGEGWDEAPQLEDLAAALAMKSVDADPILQLSLMPILHVARRATQEALASTIWMSGICPVCAAWPALAESRGLDRARVLRCGRCGSGWTLPWQLCPFCANQDHHGLSYLYSQQTGEARRVFACERCHGYLKTIATIAPIEPLDVPVEDLATLELDLAAVDAGLARPSQPGFDLEVRLRWS